MQQMERNDRRARRRRAVLALTASIIVLAAVAALVPGHSTRPRSRCVVQKPTGGNYALDPPQAQNASIIAAVAARKSLADHAVTVALAAALQESNLANLDHGDLDSVGLFQQRPSQGWGTKTQLMDPAYAAGAFFDRLATVAGWQSLAVGDVAQAVQLSARPNAYAPWEPEARAVARALTGEIPAGLTCQLANWGGPVPPPSTLDAAAHAQFGSPALGVALDAKRGWTVACWAVAHAFNYHVKSVAFQGVGWHPATGQWTADPTAGSLVTIST